MNKKAVIFGILVISLIVVIATSMSSSTDETFDVDMTRTHGSISTALGSPILGDPDAPVTIVEFGDYQCLFELSDGHIPVVRLKIRW